ncbi:MAG: methyltransferase [Candidatus Glassbacteria bacterium]|nr:methyltransferase [Candidatus Glassbacteria bacterium]
MMDRQDVITALEHRDTGRVPVDFGASPVTGMHVSCVADLREHFGLERRPVKAVEPYQMLGEIEDDLKDAIGIDFEGVAPRKTMFGFPNVDWKEWRMPDGQVVLVSGRFNTTTDERGDTLIYPEGDTTAPPSGRMPAGGFFFDAIIRQQPFEESELDPADNLEEFGPVAVEDLEYFERETARARATGRTVVANFGGTALGDIALVPAPFLKHPKGIRDITEWYISLAARKEYVSSIFEAQTGLALANLAKVHARVVDKVDVAFICGTDFGTQSGTFVSPDDFRELYLPCYRRINGWVHENTNWKTFKHSCGAVETFMELFAEAGFDIINPVQVSAAGMEADKLKERHGGRLVFWGGGVDTQAVLPFGKPAEVRAQVLERLETFSPGGGYVFNTVHNAQARTPVENLVAMIEAVKEFNGDN